MRKAPRKAPQPGPLKRLRAVVPTRAGPVRIELDGGSLHVESPSMTSQLQR